MFAEEIPIGISYSGGFYNGISNVSLYETSIMLGTNIAAPVTVGGTVLYNPI